MPIVGTQTIDIFTGAMRSEFETAYGDFTAQPAPYDAFTLTIPSGSRVEHYPFLSPTPSVAQYTGHRRVGKIGERMYAVPNLEFDASFEVLLRDLRDDQTGGYMVKSKELAAHARNFPGRWVLTTLAKGKTQLAFDGSAFFANRVNTDAGTFNNLMTGTAASSDGKTHNLIVLIVNSPIRPLIYQERLAPELLDNLADANSKFTKKGVFWCDLEGAAAYGRPQDALLVQYSNTPTLTELQTDLGLVETRFRTAALPSGMAGDTTEYVHEQLEFGTDTACIVCSTGLANLLRQVLHQDTIVQAGAAVTNVYKSWGKLIASALVNVVT